MIAPGAEIGAKQRNGRIRATHARNGPAFAAELEAAKWSDRLSAESGSLLVAEGVERARALKDHAAKLKRGRMAFRLARAGELRRARTVAIARRFGALFTSPTMRRWTIARLAGRFARRSTKAGGACARGARCALLPFTRNRRARWSRRKGIEADRIVLACGAWMNLIGGIGPEDLPPVRPVKGQMVACEPPTGISTSRRADLGRRRVSRAAARSVSSSARPSRM